MDSGNIKKGEWTGTVEQLQFVDEDTGKIEDGWWLTIVDGDPVTSRFSANTKAAVLVDQRHRLLNDSSIRSDVHIRVKGVLRAMTTAVPAPSTGQLLLIGDGKRYDSYSVIVVEKLTIASPPN